MFDDERVIINGNRRIFKGPGRTVVETEKDDDGFLCMQSALAVARYSTGFDRFGSERCFTSRGGKVW
jgi:hypothetical protein